MAPVRLAQSRQRDRSANEGKRQEDGSKGKRSHRLQTSRQHERQERESTREKKGEEQHRARVDALAQEHEQKHARHKKRLDAHDFEQARVRGLPGTGRQDEIREEVRQCQPAPDGECAGFGRPYGAEPHLDRDDRGRNRGKEQPREPR
jgi:hypothetical protein